ncbi:MBL fold metallo-hydrolase, partial [bacterium]|nr:MBL fold metallo-hydrolase [bacterium]
MKIGDIRVTALSAGRVRMDGGAIFGVVPKPLW